MEIVQCSKGHFYDSSKHKSCPYCNPREEESRTVSMGSELDALERNVHSYLDEDDIGKTVAIVGNCDESEEDDNKTIAIFSKKNSTYKMDPVVGWLIILNGESKGRDYRLHSDNNFIGRSSEMDVNLEHDSTVSRENHAVLAYDSKLHQFVLSAAGGRAIIRVNDEPVYNITKLKDYDKIEIGETIMLFRSLCGDDFSWNDDINE